MSCQYSPTSSASSSDRDSNNEQDPNQRRPPLESNGPSPKRLRLDPDHQYDFGFQPQQFCLLPQREPMARRDDLLTCDESFQSWFSTPYEGLWEDDGALNYMASPNGFRHDLYHLFPQAPTIPPVDSGPSNTTSALPRGPELKQPATFVNPDPRPYQIPPQRFQSEVLNHPITYPYSIGAQCWMAPGGMSPERAPALPIAPRFMGGLHYQGEGLPYHNHPIPRGPTSNVRFHQIPPNRPPLPTVKPAVVLVLRRATPATISDLPEHKQECPACQLDFEPDNYVANISCCDTAMHATCLSAWVNSQTYAKVKVCMKCRKGIDARRTLNNVVPPVTDKIWDEGVDLNAPQSLAADAVIELDISARPDRTVYRRARRPPHRRRLPTALVDYPPEMRSTIQKMQETNQRDAETMKNRYRTVYNNWNQAYEAEAQAAKAVSEARDALTAGRIRQEDLNHLIDRCREARTNQERSYDVYRQVSRDQDRMKRDQQSRLAAMMDDIHNHPFGAPLGEGALH